MSGVDPLDEESQKRPENETANDEVDSPKAPELTYPQIVDSGIISIVDDTQQGEAAVHQKLYGIGRFGGVSIGGKSQKPNQDCLMFHSAKVGKQNVFRMMVNDGYGPSPLGEMAAYNFALKNRQLMQEGKLLGEALTTTREKLLQQLNRQYSQFGEETKDFGVVSTSFEVFEDGKAKFYITGDAPLWIIRGAKSRTEARSPVVFEGTKGTHLEVLRSHLVKILKGTWKEESVQVDGLYKQILMKAKDFYGDTPDSLQHQYLSLSKGFAAMIQEEKISPRNALNILLGNSFADSFSASGNRAGRIRTYRGELRRGDMVLICSDKASPSPFYQQGRNLALDMGRLTNTDELVRIVDSSSMPGEVVKALARYFLSKGGPDDLTIGLFMFAGASRFA